MGWPTEKERDRHENDKHSDAPTLFKCTFDPCTYASKRESNCKQHMEKAHGWVYVRSKKNARGGSKRGSPTQATPTTSDLSTPASNPVDSPSPLFNFNDPVVPGLNADFSLFGESPASSAGLDGLQAQFQGADPEGLLANLDQFAIPFMNFGDQAIQTDNALELGIDWNGAGNFEAQNPMALQLPMYPYGYEKMGHSGYQDPGMNMYFGDHGFDGHVNEPMTGFYPGAQDAPLFSGQ